MPSSRKITWHPPFYKEISTTTYLRNTFAVKFAKQYHTTNYLHFFTYCCININKENSPDRIFSLFLHMNTNKNTATKTDRCSARVGI